MFKYIITVVLFLLFLRLSAIELSDVGKVLNSGNTTVIRFNCELEEQLKCTILLTRTQLNDDGSVKNRLPPIYFPAKLDATDNTLFFAINKSEENDIAIFCINNKAVVYDFPKIYENTPIDQSSVPWIGSCVSKWDQDQGRLLLCKAKNSLVYLEFFKNPVKDDPSTTGERIFLKFSE